MQGKYSIIRAYTLRHGKNVVSMPMGAELIGAFVDSVHAIVDSTAVPEPRVLQVVRIGEQLPDEYKYVGFSREMNWFVLDLHPSLSAPATFSKHWPTSSFALEAMQANLEPTERCYPGSGCGRPACELCNRSGSIQ